MQTPPTDEKILLKQVAEGNEQAFRQLFHEYWPHVYGVALVLTKSEAMAEDMVQDIFLKLWSKRTELPLVQNLRSWLFIIARNYIFTELGKKSREQSFTQQLVDYFSESRHNPEQHILFKETQALLNKALDNLSPQQRTVFELSREQYLTHAEIAKRLDISVNTVRNHMTQSLKKIREFLEQQQGKDLVVIICIVEAFLNTR